MEKVKEAGNAVAEKVKETTSGLSSDAHKEAAKDSNRSIGNRAGHAIDAGTDKIEEKSHEAKKEGHKEESGIIGTVTEKVKDAYNYVAEKAQELTSGASFEANKEKAKDSDNRVGERIGAGINAVGDKIEEKSHEAQAKYHKEQL
ncbi:unnamed protein product [Didymodactylos carnosus]|uniref:Uncharacterized protein n=1 Tax=Didymodactylos carnosus TaxID=1234261 RepID=A0A815WYD0_9BILA|nr:unnamed protein product [Didymodactylos carnosus]CAF1550424.1 unnamed protein product [Didymodactylos carnosus]CAF4072896.1 unnamed protein product [Didymodactylos carnosus]CAF4411483.1 unnamed protein product [Didymodactylos carnosus]